MAKLHTARDERLTIIAGVIGVLHDANSTSTGATLKEVALSDLDRMRTTILDFLRRYGNHSWYTLFKTNAAKVIHERVIIKFHD